MCAFRTDNRCERAHGIKPFYSLLKTTPVVKLQVCCMKSIKSLREKLALTPF